MMSKDDLLYTCIFLILVNGLQKLVFFSGTPIVSCVLHFNNHLNVCIFVNVI